VVPKIGGAHLPQKRHLAALDFPVGIATMGLLSGMQPRRSIDAFGIIAALNHDDRAPWLHLKRITPKNAELAKRHEMAFI
jgi:hypothetical protein